MKVIKILFGLFIALFFVSGILVFLIPLMGITWGIISTVVGVIWNLVTHPVVLVLMVALLAYGYFKKSNAK